MIMIMSMATRGTKMRHGGLDPHVWLDPSQLGTIATEVARRLGEIDPAHRADFDANARALTDQLGTLDRDFRQGLSDCARREFVTTHAAFGYLARRYDLEQLSISGLSPEAEPSPTRLAEVQQEAREHQITTIFFETLVSPAVAQSLASRPRPADRRARPDRGHHRPVPRPRLRCRDAGQPRCAEEGQRMSLTDGPRAERRRRLRRARRTAGAPRHHARGAGRRGGGAAGRKRLGKVDPGPRPARPGARPARLGGALRPAPGVLPPLVSDRLRPAALDREPERGEGQGGGRLRPPGPSTTLRAASARGPGRGGPRPGVGGPQRPRR